MVVIRFHAELDGRVRGKQIAKFVLAALATLAAIALGYPPLQQLLRTALGW